MRKRMKVVKKMTFLIMGKTGMGKSYFTCSLIDYLAENRKLVMITDQNRDIEMLDQIVDFPKLTHVEVTGQNVNRIPYAKLISEEQAMAFEFMNVLDDEQNDALNEICRVIYNEGDTVLYIDECHLFFPRFNYPVELERLIRGGRKFGIDTVLVTQQVVDLRKTALRQAYILVLFRITEENELKKLKDMGININIVSNLPPYKCLIIDTITGEESVTDADSFTKMMV